MRTFVSEITALFILTLVISALHWLGVLANWYNLYPIDVPLHMLGGAWVALASYYVFYIRHATDFPRTKLPFLLINLGVVALVGIGWEIFEYAVDVWAGRYGPFAAPGYVHFDTLKDLVNDCAGGIIALLVTQRSSSSRTASS